MSVVARTPSAAGTPSRLLPGVAGAEENRSLLVAVAAAVLVVLWAGHNGYYQTLVVTACTYALIALGMYIPFVLAGSLSVAYGAYASIGAYSVALISHDTALPIWLAWLIAPPISALVAVVLGLATRRLSGFYLVAVTLLFAEAFQTWLSSASFTHGNAGLSDFRPLGLFGWEPSYNVLVVASVGFVLLLAYLVDRLRRSPWGVTLSAMREIPAAVEATGVRVPWLDLVGLAVGAGVGSLGGTLFAQMVNGVQPQNFTISIVFLAVFMPIIGGMGTPWGAVLGAALVVEFTINIPSFQAGGLLLVSLAVLAVMLVAPQGLISYLDSGRRAVVRRVKTGRDRT